MGISKEKDDGSRVGKEERGEEGMDGSKSG